MIIVNYTSENYKECLDTMKPTWENFLQVGDKLLLYSDTGKFGEKVFEPSEDFNESCRRKILTIQKVLKENQGENVLYIDTDVMMMSFIPQDVFYKDVVATRMVHRKDKGGEKDINAGVSFWKANERTIKFCERWLEDEKEYQDFKYPEQHAFNELCYRGYDGQEDYSVGNVSERIYNFEHDNPNVFLKWIPIYKPKLVHFKSKRWSDAFIMNRFKKIVSSA